jgi:hypothetical protein
MDAESRPGIEFYRFATRRITPVFTIEMQPTRQEPSLSAIVDGRTIYYSQYDSSIRAWRTFLRFRLTVGLS